MKTLIETEPPTLNASNTTRRNSSFATWNTRGVPPRLPIAHCEDTPEATSAYACLMRVAVDNTELVEQFIAHEQRLSPGRPRPEAIVRANARWNRGLPAAAPATATNHSAAVQIRIVRHVDQPDAVDTGAKLPWAAVGESNPATTTTRQPGPTRRADFLEGVWTAPAPHESLLLKAMGDQALVERLIGYELRRLPGLSRSEAIERANDRWERDLSR